MFTFKLTNNNEEREAMDIGIWLNTGEVEALGVVLAGNKLFHLTNNNDEKEAMDIGIWLNTGKVEALGVVLAVPFNQVGDFIRYLCKI